MTDTVKTLGQLNPAATTLTTLYTVPAATSTVIASLIVCNSGNTPTTFRVSIAVAAAADNIKQYIYYDVVINPNDTFIATIGVTLATTDLIRAYAGNANLSFSVFGVEAS